MTDKIGNLVEDNGQYSEAVVILVQNMISGNSAYLSTFTDMAILWWVSSTVFCGGIIGTVFARRSEIRILPTKHRSMLFYCVTLLFLTIIFYGFYCCYSMSVLKYDTERLILIIFNISSIQEEINFSLVAYDIFIVGCAIGTSSFVLVLVVWICLWFLIAKSTGHDHQPSISGLLLIPTPQVIVPGHKTQRGHNSYISKIQGDSLTNQVN